MREKRAGIIIHFISSLENQIDVLEEELQELYIKKRENDARMKQPSIEVLQECNRKKYEQMKMKLLKLTDKKERMKSILRTNVEELLMTKEDLSSKLMQRADFVADREELEQLYEQVYK